MSKRNEDIPIHIINKMSNADEFRRNIHYQIPKELFTNSKYKKMSIASKMLYGILDDRQELSKMNGRIQEKWLDENNCIFFYFDCRKLAEICGVSTNTLNNYKKELIGHGLLYQVRQGQGKPNRMYTLKVDVETVENTENIKSSENSNSRNTKNATLEKRNSLHNDTKNNNTDIKDTEVCIKGNLSPNFDPASQTDNFQNITFANVKTSIPKDTFVDDFLDGIDDDPKPKPKLYSHEGHIIKHLLHIEDKSNTLDEYVRVVNYYLQKYRMIMYKEHPPFSIKTLENIEGIFCAIDYIHNRDDYIVPDVVIKMIDRHFVTEYKNCDYNINHFLSPNVHYNRYCEVVKDENI